jgi:hypothetical protein
MYICSIIFLLIALWFLMRPLPLNAIVLVFWLEVISQCFDFIFYNLCKHFCNKKFSCYYLIICQGMFFIFILFLLFHIQGYS